METNQKEKGHGLIHGSQTFGFHRPAYFIFKLENQGTVATICFSSKISKERYKVFLSIITRSSEKEQHFNTKKAERTYSQNKEIFFPRNYGRGVTLLGAVQYPQISHWFSVPIPQLLCFTCGSFHQQLPSEDQPWIPRNQELLVLITESQRCPRA